METTDLNTELADKLARATEDYFQLVSEGSAVDIDQFASEYPEIKAVLLSVLPALKLVRSEPLSAETEQTCSVGIEAGLRLGDFELIEGIGRGGMGVVFLARQISLERKVAIKILPFLATLDSRRIRRFQNESQAVAGLDHPHIVEVYSVGTEDGVHFYAMQYIEGFTLAELLSQLRVANLEPTPHPSEDLGEGTIESHSSEGADEASGRNAETARVLARSNSTLAGSCTNFGSGAERYRYVAQLFVDISDAIHHSHQCGVIHRDIKPSNIMVDSSGKGWVMDFGLAQVASNESLTLSQDLLGTLRYMSPEQLEVGQPVDHRLDVYGLGATLYEMLTLRPLVAGRDRESILASLRSGIQIAPTQYQPDLPRDLETIVMKAVERVPENRFQTAAQLAEDLRLWLEGLPVSARPLGRFEQAVRWCRRNPIVAALIAATILLSCSIAVGSIVAAKRISDQNDLLVDRNNTLLEERRRATAILETITSSDGREHIARLFGLAFATTFVWVLISKWICSELLPAGSSIGTPQVFAAGMFALIASVSVIAFQSVVRAFKQFDPSADLRGLD